MREKSRSARIRERLTHPIIDSDGHVAEFEPAFSTTSRRSRAAGRSTASRSCQTAHGIFGGTA
jgi:hypothetical protein